MVQSLTPPAESSVSTATHLSGDLGWNVCTVVCRAPDKRPEFGSASSLKTRSASIAGSWRRLLPEWFVHRVCAESKRRATKVPTFGVSILESELMQPGPDVTESLVFQLMFVITILITAVI